MSCNWLENFLRKCFGMKRKRVKKREPPKLFPFKKNYEEVLQRIISEKAPILISDLKLVKSKPVTPTTPSTLRSPEVESLRKTSTPTNANNLSLPSGEPTLSPSKYRTEDLTEIYTCENENISFGDILLSQGYQLRKQLGRGTYASVYRARNIDPNKNPKVPRLVACKIIDITNCSTNQSNSIKNELFILERINHPNTIYLYNHFIIKSPIYKRVFIFLQLASGGSLSVYVRKKKNGIPEKQAQRMFAQIVSAVNHLHQNLISHRDIKMGNVLLDENNNCLLTDFGLSRIFKENPPLTDKFCGTMPYMSPEILTSKYRQRKYNPFIADIWALGVLLYCIINRGYPFIDGPRHKMVEQQLSHNIVFSRRCIFPIGTDLTYIMHGMLDPNPNKRITIEELMCNNWLKNEIKIIDEIIRKREEKEMIVKTIESFKSKLEWKTNTCSSTQSAPTIYKPTKTILKVDSSKILSRFSDGSMMGKEMIKPNLIRQKSILPVGEIINEKKSIIKSSKTKQMHFSKLRASKIND